MNKENTLFFVDWDDTLFPTSWTQRNKINLSNNIPLKKRNFASLDSEIHKVLDNMLKFGKVIIVTNATSVWIRMCLTILPKTQSLINKFILVVSARERCQKSKPYHLWKHVAFRNELMSHYIKNNKRDLNIISIGDAVYEHQALLSLRNWKPINKKILKFVEQPTFVILMKELKTLFTEAEKIANLNNDSEILLFKK